MLAIAVRWLGQHNSFTIGSYIGLIGRLEMKLTKQQTDKLVSEFGSKFKVAFVESYSYGFDIYMVKQGSKSWYVLFDKDGSYRGNINTSNGLNFLQRTIVDLVS
jgi:hypothetical protein